MTFLEDGYFSYGNTKSPVTSSTTNSLLLDADPALYYIIKYFQGVLNLHIMPRWNAEVALVGLSNLIGDMPNEVLPYDPFRSGLSPDNAWRFPLLAVYPKGSTYGMRTVTYWNITRNLEMIFSLPPLNSEQYEHLFPFLQLFEKVISDRTMQGVDGYFNNGELVWAESGVEKMTVVSSSFGNIAFNTDMVYPTVIVQLQAVERRMPDLRNFQSIAGVDLNVSTATVDPNNPQDIADTKTTL